jgi:hypothetical protein
MKKILLYIFFIIYSASFFPQEIKWENLSAGIVINHLITQGDLKEYWNNTPEGGLLINYIIDKNLSFEGSISVAYLKPKPGENQSSTGLPDIFLVNMPAGLKFSFFPGEIFSFNLSGGITNTTFIFTGDAAESLKENNIESEFGVFISAGLGCEIFNNINIELCPNYQKIFGTPNINLYRIGIKIFFDL